MRKLLLCTFFIAINYTHGQGTIGDGGRIFDNSKTVSGFNSKQQRWAKAGVVNGIRQTGSVTRTVNVPAGGANASSSINTAINQVSNNGGGIVFLKAGEYNITRKIVMRQGVRLQGVGSGGNGTRINIQINSGNAIEFKDLNQPNNKAAGLFNLRVKGRFGAPDPAIMANARNNYNATGVSIVRSKNCYIDSCVILNTGNTPIDIFSGSHNTVRNTTVDGVWNKGQGGRGYLQIAGADNLIYNCTIRKIRHFALQNSKSKFNVVYGNRIFADINFHNRDGGDNLIENNQITIPSYMNGPNTGGRRYVVMGPWSTQHKPSLRDNFVYNNTVNNFAFSGTVRCNSKGLLYKGADKYEPGKGGPGAANGNPFSRSQNVGTGKKFYATKSASARLAENSKVIDETSSFKAYPNPLPSGETLQLKNIPEAFNSSLLTISDLSGKVVLKQYMAHEKHDETLDANLLNAGMYIMSLETDGKTQIQKIVVQ